MLHTQTVAACDMRSDSEKKTHIPTKYVENNLYIRLISDEKIVKYLSTSLMALFYLG